MRPAHTGSMTAPARPRAGDLAASRQRLLATASTQPDAPERTPVSQLPVKRALVLQKLLSQRLATQTKLVWQLSQWSFSAAWNPQAANEALALTSAFWEQCAGLQAQWENGLAALMEEMGEIRETNTMSKFAEQEINFMQQAMALATSQAGPSVQLFENMNNNLGYWLERQLEPQKP